MRLVNIIYWTRGTGQHFGQFSPVDRKGLGTISQNYSQTPRL